MRKVFWTPERLQEEASKYNHRSDFMNGSSSAYATAHRLGVLDKICSHMTRKEIPALIWPRERIETEALKYNTRKEFKNGCPGAHNAAIGQGILNEVCAHMSRIQNLKHHWSKARCAEEALKYTTKSEMKEGSPAAYSKMQKSGWVYELTAHMIPGFEHPRGSLTEERCIEIAKPYRTKSEFKDAHPSVYAISLKNGWHDEVCGHMVPLGNHFNKALYVFEFADGSAYIGLTFDYEDRMYRHQNDEGSAIYHKLKEGIKFKLIKFDKFLPAAAAQLEEDRLIKEYTSNGWEVLNRAKAGSLGGTIKKWDLELCTEEAKKYASRSSFNKGSTSAYQAALNNGWLDEVCAHMKPHSKRVYGYKHRPGNVIPPKWDKERCIAEGLKYETRTAFWKNSGAAYSAALRNDWLDQACAHMNTKPRKKRTRKKNHSIDL